MSITSKMNVGMVQTKASPLNYFNCELLSKNKSNCSRCERQRKTQEEEDKEEEKDRGGSKLSSS